MVATMETTTGIALAIRKPPREHLTLKGATALEYEVWA